jgi:G6PDH family F420-dependent oxidoreductase
LNEHIVGQRWPAADVRLEMLEEAIDVIRTLWKGGQQSYYGNHYTVENAQIYTLPKDLPPILVAGGGEKSATLAGRVGDGFIGTAPKKELLQGFAKSGGKNKSCFGEVTVCWADDEADALETAYEYWPNAAITGELTQELPAPAHFEQAAKMVSEDDMADSVICGSDPDRHIEAIEKYADAGYDHVWIHQIGPEQEGFFRFYKEDVIPKLRRSKMVASTHA